jgi:ribosomal protein S12 methylthiotransferase accessory factor
MTVGLVGSGPALAAVEAALGDADVGTQAVEQDAVAEFELAVVVGQAGDAVFERVNEVALAADQRWIAVELGGVGGFPVVDAAVAGFGPEAGCYECLSGRVSANLDPQAEPTAAPPSHTARFAGAVAGRQAVGQLLGDGDIIGEVIEIPHAERAFLPLPHCVCDGERTRLPVRTTVDRDLSESLARAERAVDDRVGLVQEVGEAESFPVPYYLAHACDTAGFSDATAGRDAAGVAAGWDAAFMKALGESIERYAAGVYQTSAFEIAPEGAVSNPVSPTAFAGVDAAEPSEEIEWVAGENLLTGTAVQLPAEFVQYPPPSKRYRSPVTTGLGLGNDGTEALLAGLYEVIERDAAMLSWYSTFEPLALDVGDAEFETLVARARSEGLSVSTLLLTQDVDVPVVAVAVHGETWPQFALGSGANLDVAVAARSALAEALQNWMELRGMGSDDAADAMGAIGRYADSPPERYIAGNDPVPATAVGPDEVPRGEAELAELLDRLEETGLAAYATRTTTRDVSALGFEAVRVVVPAAQPLLFGDVTFGERAETVPEAMGFEPRLDRDHHPFP